MLWTVGGLWLLFGLGVIVGACLALFTTGAEGRSWREWIFALGVAAVGGALYLIFEWLGPAGGG